MNLALGAKIILTIVISRLEWWKKVLCNKHFNQSHKRCLDGLLGSKKESHIWNLLKYVAPIIHSKLTWILDNSKLIQI
jgi:hypothetical protein